MLTIKALMTSPPVTLAPEMTLREAIERLAAKRLSGAPVVAGGRVLGTLSANDILAFVAATPPEPDAGSDEAASPELVDAPWTELEAGPAAYFADYWDDRGADATERMDAPAAREHDVLDDHTVAEAMSTRVMMLPPTASLRAAAESMQRAGVHRVLVGDGDRLLGIVTTMDITKAFAWRLIASGGAGHAAD